MGRPCPPSPRAGSWCSSQERPPRPSWNYPPRPTSDRSTVSCTTRARRNPGSRRLGLLPERLSHPRRLDHFRLHVVAQDPPTHLQCVGHVQCQLEPPVRQVAELLARVPEALADVPRELLREDHLHSDERSEEHTSELQSLAYLVCRLLLE